MAQRFSELEGIWHTGLCVFEKEYYYGSGISADPIGETPFGTPTKCLSLGYTIKSEEDFSEFWWENYTTWTEANYDIAHQNCNHFSNAASNFLIDKGIPFGILDQSNQFCSTYLG